MGVYKGGGGRLQANDLSLGYSRAIFIPGLGKLPIYIFISREICKMKNKFVLKNFIDDILFFKPQQGKKLFFFNPLPDIILSIPYNRFHKC